MRATIVGEGVAIDGVIEREIKAVFVEQWRPAQRLVSEVHAVPRQLAGNRPIHRNVDDIAGLDVIFRPIYCVMIENFFCQRHPCHG